MKLNYNKLKKYCDEIPPLGWWDEMRRRFGVEDAARRRWPPTPGWRAVRRLVEWHRPLSAAPTWPHPPRQSQTPSWSLKNPKIRIQTTIIRLLFNLTVLPGNKFDKWLAGGFRHSQEALDCVLLLPQQKETLLSLGPAGMKPSSCPDLVVHQFGTDFPNSGHLAVQLLLALVQPGIAVQSCRTIHLFSLGYFLFKSKERLDSCQLWWF